MIRAAAAPQGLRPGPGVACIDAYPATLGEPMPALTPRILIIAAALAAAAGLVVAARGRHRRVLEACRKARDRVAALASRNGAPDAVEEASLESFPASDPPSAGSAGL